MSQDLSGHSERVDIRLATSPSKISFLSLDIHRYLEIRKVLSDFQSFNVRSGQIYWLGIMSLKDGGSIQSVRIIFQRHKSSSMSSNIFNAIPMQCLGPCFIGSVRGALVFTVTGLSLAINMLIVCSLLDGEGFTVLRSLVGVVACDSYQASIERCEREPSAAAAAASDGVRFR